jgi:hypothetical protein
MPINVHWLLKSKMPIVPLDIGFARSVIVYSLLRISGKALSSGQMRKADFNPTAAIWLDASAVENLISPVSPPTVYTRWPERLATWRA